MLNSEAAKAYFGKNYDKAIKAGQSAYTAQLEASWANSSSRDIVLSLSNNPDYYKKMMGASSYRNMLDQARNGKIGK